MGKKRKAGAAKEDDCNKKAIKKRQKAENNTSSSSESESEDEFTMLGLSGEALKLARKLSAKMDKCKDAAKKSLLQSKLLMLLEKVAQQQQKDAAKKPAVKQPVHAFDSNRNKPYIHDIVGKETVKSFTVEELKRRQLRQQRFESATNAHEDPDTLKVLHEAGGLGTCEALEKEYLRLTSLPRASDVRPPRVLKAALKLVQARWTREADYKYACEQLKSIRQDLTVQHVRDGLTVQAYETHARIALEVSDLAEFNQCHAVLKTLYADGIPGNEDEFNAYGLLYALIACGFKGASTGGARQVLATELRSLLYRDQQTFKHTKTASNATPQDDVEESVTKGGQDGTLQPERRKVKFPPPHSPETQQGGLTVGRCTAHALQVLRAFRCGDWTTYIQLYSQAPRMTPYLMDLLLAHVRSHAMMALLVAHRPMPLPVVCVQVSLGFDTTEQAVQFITANGCTLDESSSAIDTRVSLTACRAAVS